MTDKDIIIFRKLIKYYFLIFITFALKGFFFPDAFVPEDLQFVVRKYEDEIMEYSPPILFAAIISAVIYLISFIMIYRLKINWRMIHLVSLIILTVCNLELRFSFLDSLDYLLESMMYMLNGAIVYSIFFGSVSRKFK